MIEIRLKRFFFLFPKRKKYNLYYSHNKYLLWILYNTRVYIITMQRDCGASCFLKISKYLHFMIIFVTFMSRRYTYAKPLTCVIVVYGLFYIHFINYNKILILLTDTWII